MGELLMPSLGADMDAGTIVEWRIAPGDEVRHGDVVAVVDTEKSDIDVEVFEDGVVEEILVAPGREVAVGTPLARIGTGAAPFGAPAPRDATSSAPAPTVPTAGPAPSPDRTVPSTPDDGWVRASPLARRTAAAHGIALGDVPGSGPGGAVVLDDLGPAAEVATPVRPPAPRVTGPTAPPPTPDAARAARAVGELMARSAREVPHYHLASTVDLSAATTWLARHNADRPPAERILPAALLLAATARAAAEVPGFNGTWDDRYVPADGVHLGVAVALRGGGLIAPAIRDADRLGVAEVMDALRSIVAGARRGRLRASEMSAPTLTVTNLGDQGAEEVHGVIYRPQVALVGFGRIAERPWAEDGMVGARPTVRMTLAADHRVTDGHQGSRFLAAIAHHLATPEEL